MDLGMIIAQGFGIAGMTFNILSYQMKKQRNVILMQMFGGLLFAINMFMISAFIGGILNVVAVIRAIVFANKQRIRNIKLCTVMFIVSYALSYILVFTVFGKAINTANLITELLPIIGMTALSIGFAKNNASDIRKYGLISSPSWLIYNCINLSIGGIICETMSLISILTAYLRYDKK